MSMPTTNVRIFVAVDEHGNYFAFGYGSAKADADLDCTRGEFDGHVKNNFDGAFSHMEDDVRTSIVVADVPLPEPKIVEGRLLA